MTEHHEYILYKTQKYEGFGLLLKILQEPAYRYRSEIEKKTEKYKPRNVGQILKKSYFFLSSHGIRWPVNPFNY